MANYCITFSPTGGVNRIADILAGALHSQWIQIDLMTETKLETTENDVCQVAVPSFGGRVADFAVQRLKGITGPAKAIAVCVYGNRAYEDTLVELQDILTEQGLRVLAAVAAVAEHSIMHSVAAGRPDDADARQLADFARYIASRLRRKSETTWHRACLVAGILLMCWTVTEMLIIPNGLSVFYLVLGILQTIAAVVMIRRESQA